jgi:O-antigen ligase
MVILSFVAFCFVPYAVKRFSQESASNNYLYRASLIAMFLMILWAAVSFFSSDIPKTQQFYGVWGRNTGFLTFFCLLLVSIQSFLFITNRNIEILLRWLFYSSTLSAAYGLIQFVGLEPIDYKNGYSPLIGFFGNPNFQSTFLGLGALSSIWFAICAVKGKYGKVLPISISFLELFLIYRSGSIQGIFVFIISISTVVAFIGIEKLKQPLRIAGVTIFTAFGLLGVFGVLGIGPISRFFDGYSLEFRRVYWRIGMRMIEENKIFGIGFDGYGDYFRRFRTLEDNQLLSGTVTNAAHNVFIDFGVSAGLPFLLVYLGLVLSAIWLMLKKQVIQSTSLEFKALSGLFLAFHCEMLIGINQIGLAIWGFVFLGSILGLLIKSNFSEASIKGKRLVIQNRNSIKFISVFVLFVLAIVVATPPLQADYNFRKSLFAGDGQRVFSAGIARPIDMNRLISAGDLMRGNGLIDESKVIADTAIGFNPDSIYTWLYLLSIPSISTQERENAVKNAKRLDPLWEPK